MLEMGRIGTTQEALAPETRIEDRNLTGIRRLTPPRALKESLPLTTKAAATVLEGRRQLRACLRGEDMRLVVVVGPCSIHDPDAALEDGERLARTAGPLSDALRVVMRTYFEKPRTTVGWKGLINDPHLDGTRDVVGGLTAARGLLMQLNELGLPCASEVLDPFTPQFVADLLTWASIGARTAESQTHRELASGLSMPVGFKNGTDGNLDVARNAMVAARHPHTFLGICADGSSAVVSTKGNRDCHLVLRGGSAGPNFDAESVARAVAMASEGEACDSEIRRPVLVDCSHGNSQKDHRRQAEACRAVLEQFRSGQNGLLGVMLESNLEEGRQDWSPDTRLRRGVSITDACIGWEATEELLNELAEAVRSRG